MVIPAAGQVVVVPFPFSNLSQAKPGPAVMLANAGRGDWILGQVTSRPYGDPRAMRIEDHSLTDGALQMTSYIRPSKLFTGNDALCSPPPAYSIPDSSVRLLVL